jgi:predicted metal-dependent hydrolase
MPADHAIKARRVAFDFGKTPMHWIPDDAFSTHVINVLHLLLPAGEKWFCDVYRQAMPLVHDDQLRADVKGFIGQEAIHGRAHSSVLDHLSAQGLETKPYTRRVEWMFNRLLGDYGLTNDHGPMVLRRYWIVSRLAIIAAIEHFTCILGWWVISGAGGLDEAGADPVMLDLLRWHGAEEVEHRSVAFDMFQETSGSYFRRLVAMAVVMPVIGFLWIVGTRYLIKHDPQATRKDRASLRRYVKMSHKDRLPRVGYLLASIPRFLKPRFHPSAEASTERALAYLAHSPAAQSYAA